MRAIWQMFEGALSPEAVDEFVKTVEKEIPTQTATVNFGDNQNVDSVTRRSEVRWVNQDFRNIFSDIHNTLNPYMKLANRNAFGFDINYIDSYQFTTYKGEDKGFYDWHEDVFWDSNIDMIHRKISMTLQLSDSDDYEGGDFEFQSPIEMPKKEALRKKGTILLFPSFVRHRVKPVTKGVRKSLVGWYEGPKFR